MLFLDLHTIHDKSVDECKTNLSKAVDSLTKEDFVVDVTKDCMVKSNDDDFEHDIAHIDDKLLDDGTHEDKARSVIVNLFRKITVILSLLYI